jgi:hypothetical protein
LGATTVLRVFEHTANNPARTAALKHSRIPEAQNLRIPESQSAVAPTQHHTRKTACYVGFARPGKPPLIHAAWHDVHAAKSDIRRVKPRVAVRCMRGGVVMTAVVPKRILAPPLNIDHCADLAGESRPLPVLAVHLFLVYCFMA